MQAFSDPSLNFLFVLGFLIVFTICCVKACNRDGQGCGGSGSSTGTGGSMSSRLLSGCGMVFLVLGMAFYYSFGYYAIGLYAPLLVIAMILIVAGGCKARADQDSIPPATQQRTYSHATQHFKPEPAVIQPPDAETIVRIANLARDRGFLDERTDPNDPTIVIPGIKCPSCGVRSDLELARIVNNIVHCPNCRYRIAL